MKISVEASNVLQITLRTAFVASLIWFAGMYIAEAELTAKFESFTQSKKLISFVTWEFGSIILCLLFLINKWGIEDVSYHYELIWDDALMIFMSLGILVLTAGYIFLVGWLGFEASGLLNTLKSSEEFYSFTALSVVVSLFFGRGAAIVHVVFATFLYVALSGNASDFITIGLFASILTATGYGFRRLLQFIF